MKLSIIIPCYNESKNLCELISAYRELVSDYPSTELILVDNGSSDETDSLLQKELARSDNYFLKTVKVEKNEGYGHGIMAGLKVATGDYLAWSHADHQCPPRDVFRLFEAIEKTGEPNRCFGKGFRVTQRGKGATLVTQIHSILATLLLRVKLDDVNAQPKVFPAEFLRLFHFPPKGLELDLYAYYLAQKAKMRIVQVDVEFLDRREGESSWSSSLFLRLKTLLKGTTYLFTLRFCKGVNQLNRSSTGF